MDFYISTIWSILKAFPITLEIWFCGIVFGLCIACLLTWARASGIKTLEMFVRGYVFVFRGSPLLAQIYLLYYGSPQIPFIRNTEILWAIFQYPMPCAIMAMALNTAAYESEIFRGALKAVPLGPIEAAKAYGMNPFTRFRRIIFPIAMRLALPAYSTEVILMTKATALASVITIMEMMGVTQKIQHDTFKAVETLLCAGVIYLLLNFCIARAFAMLEYRLSPHLRPPPQQGTTPTPIAEVL